MFDIVVLHPTLVEEFEIVLRFAAEHEIDIHAAFLNEAADRRPDRAILAARQVHFVPVRQIPRVQPFGEFGVLGLFFRQQRHQPFVVQLFGDGVVDFRHQIGGGQIMPVPLEPHLRIDIAKPRIVQITRIADQDGPGQRFVRAFEIVRFFAFDFHFAFSLRVPVNQDSLPYTLV